MSYYTDQLVWNLLLSLCLVVCLSKGVVWNQRFLEFVFCFEQFVGFLVRWIWSSYGRIKPHNRPRARAYCNIAYCNFISHAFVSSHKQQYRKNRGLFQAGYWPKSEDVAFFLAKKDFNQIIKLKKITWMYLGDA